MVEELHLNVMARTSWDVTKSGFTTTGFSFLEAASAGKTTSLTSTRTRGDNRKALLSVQKNSTINLKPSSIIGHFLGMDQYC